MGECESERVKEWERCIENEKDTDAWASNLSKTDGYSRDITLPYTHLYLCHGVDVSSLQLAIHLGQSLNESRVAVTTSVLIQEWLLCCLCQSINQEGRRTEVGKPLQA